MNLMFLAIQIGSITLAQSSIPYETKQNQWQNGYVSGLPSERSWVQPSLGPMNLMFFVIQIGSVTGKVGGIIAV